MVAGDIVHLKHDKEILMTITSINLNVVSTVWFDTDKHTVRDTFQLKQLVLVENVE